MAKKILRKTDVYPIEKVEERIAYYKEIVKTIGDDDIAKMNINNSLLKFWETYKINNFKT